MVFREDIGHHRCDIVPAMQVSVTCGGNGSDLVSAIAALMGAIIGAAATVGGQWWFERRRAGMRARLVLGQLSALLDTLKDTEAETNVR